ncbi:hypothetical protein M9Y10_001644 [Tritrichomonas musculus]|uniref:DUF3447 domain-containing protein n=1 Tax=Tritrichomonas musculus TaxID=1915356 RepID=A0ABR2LAJ9_9EUKA
MRFYKKILHFLFRTKILKVDESIYSYLIYKKQLRLFFYPEIEEFKNEKNIGKIEDAAILDNFEGKRNNGENDSYICSLIRKDAIEDFVAYVNKTNMNLSSEIEPSIFETNSFLNKHNATLIEYAAFFGSIRIFKYLELNGVKLKPSLWLYSIHGRNAELVHHLESNKIPPPKGGYEKCFCESIKCHHNEFASYIENYLLDNENENANNKLLSSIFRYNNYLIFPNEITSAHFFYLCLYNYSNLVDFYLIDKEKDIKEIIICKHNLFLNGISFFLFSSNFKVFKFLIQFRKLLTLIVFQFK